MSNIQVVVRCRERTPREVMAKSQVVVDLPDHYSISQPTITINTGQNNLLSQKIICSADSKTYNYDQVYGPLADQELIFHKAVSPIFKEFLKGFNVTVLAYGQTGTGKTYTMCGESSEWVQSKTILISKTSGIIPRVLDQLFRSLNTEDEDYVVKCSFIELYNENLRDLLNDDNDDRNLKIFENKNGNSGILIQNLKEVNINNLNSGFDVLYKGLSKRKVASTKMNDFSSRSHTIFTINLYKKEGDIIKHSKMNLVDLAGSENVSKSGSLNQRAKEAGSINQSLLTLGRVINSLSEKSINQSHIPYRESKLTRLLQDSIGGKTKTLLISTISPAKINLEETLSTLVYSLKVRNIENKPQLGHDFDLIMKNVYIKDLSNEIIKLNNDLISTRNKNGIFMDELNYNNIIEENMSNRNEIHELKSKLKLYENTIEKLTKDIEVKEEAEVSLTKEITELKQTQIDMSTKIDNLKTNINNSIRLAELLNANDVEINSNARESIELVTVVLKKVVLMKNSFQNGYSKVTEQIDGSLKQLPSILNNMIKTLNHNDGNFNKFKNNQNELNSKLKSINNQFQQYLNNYYKEINLPQIIDSFYQATVESKIRELKTNFNNELKSLVDSQFNSFNEISKVNLSKFSSQLINNDLNKISQESNQWSNQSNDIYKQLTNNLNEYQSNLKNSLNNNQDKLVEVSNKLKADISKSITPSLDKLSQDFTGSNDSLLDQINSINKINTENIELVNSNVQEIDNFNKTNDFMINKAALGANNLNNFDRRNASPNKSSRSSSKSPSKSRSPQKFTPKRFSSKVPILDKENRIPDLKRRRVD